LALCRFSLGIRIHLFLLTIGLPALQRVSQKKILKINNVNYKYTSAAPYLSDKTGFFFHNIEQLNKKIKDYYTNRLIFSARKWVLKNMTDTISVKNILNILNNLKNKNN